MNDFDSRQFVKKTSMYNQFVLKSNVESEIVRSVTKGGKVRRNEEKRVFGFCFKEILVSLRPSLT